MNILFDLIASQPEGNLKYHGGSEYAKAVFRAILSKTQGRLFCLYDSQKNLDEEISSICKINGIPLIDIRIVLNAEDIIERYSIERFYSALPLEKSIQQILPFNPHVRSIITIHGLRSIELTSDINEIRYITGFYKKLKFVYKNLFPGKYTDKLLFRIKALINNYYKPTIITVSNYSGLSLKYFIPEIPQKDIHILYSPITDYSQIITDDSFLVLNNINPGKYFLLLSAGIWQKNSYRILSAFSSLIKSKLSEGYKFVVTGALDSMKKSFPGTSFIYFDYLERQELETLLKNAHALVYPSLNEGFGYPPLEAFKYGTGVIASAIGPVMEVCGNAALYFNPYSLTEMKIRLMQSINDPVFKDNASKRIDQYAKIKYKQMNDLEELAELICN